MARCYLLIVEGKTDRAQLATIVPKTIPIICTNGTKDEEALLDLLESHEQYDFVTLFDADRNGEKLRKIMNRIYPEAIQIIIPVQYKEVAETPVNVLKQLLQKHKIVE